jgi:acetyl-CoA carboxylase biotin carboxyl carrier protein
VSLTAQDVAQITRLLEESNFDELDLELDGLKLSIRRGSAANVHPLADPAAGRSPTPGPTTPASGATAPARPGAPPFVAIGSQVEENTIVGIIEVMKLMNTVRAGVRGKVIQILGRDGALVEYGETLLRLSKMS